MEDLHPLTIFVSAEVARNKEAYAIRLIPIKAEPVKVEENKCACGETLKKGLTTCWTCSEEPKKEVLQKTASETKASEPKQVVPSPQVKKDVPKIAPEVAKPGYCKKCKKAKVDKHLFCKPCFNKLPQCLNHDCVKKTDDTTGYCSYCKRAQSCFCGTYAPGKLDERNLCPECAAYVPQGLCTYYFKDSNDYCGAECREEHHKLCEEHFEQIQLSRQ